MNENNQAPEFAPDQELAPLDPFERQWADQLAQRDPELTQTEDAFVQTVMRQVETTNAAGQTPAVVGRIGTATLPYAVAAGLMLLAFIGGYWLIPDAGVAPHNDSIAKQPDNPTQPGSQSTVAANDRPKVALGSLIANAKTTATGPANRLTATVSDTSNTLSIDRLFNLLDGSVPDFKELLEPLEPKNEQSRA